MEARLTQDSTNDSYRSDLNHRKRLGQYFTGTKLARLLAYLARTDNDGFAIDPMCGNGDMIEAIRSIAPSKQMYGIEIDKNTLKLCANRFKATADKSYVHLIEGDAFSWDTISRLKTYEYDLVITNPPYVRYQSLTGSAESIRRSLINIAERLPSLTEEDRDIFVSIIKGYSGLSDLAVPSWILCAMLTKIGGKLAMVVPETWLNRDYALPIHYLLLKFFRIKWVVEDVNRAWFDDAQIKTNLIVAERIKRVDHLESSTVGQAYPHISLPSTTINDVSIVGNVFLYANDPDKEFIRMLELKLNDNEVKLSHGISLTYRYLEKRLKELLPYFLKTNWFIKCEPTYKSKSVDISNSCYTGIPDVLYELLKPNNESNNFGTIDQLGGNVSQGLRTGANTFFYCDLISEKGNYCYVQSNKKLGVGTLLVPKEALRTVLRKQSELTKGFRLNNKDLKGRVLILESFIHPSDFEQLDEYHKQEVLKSKRIMDNGLADYVTVASKKNVGTLVNPKYIPLLSAVRTNVNKKKGKEARYWYMLPPLMKRHLPDLFIPRVNYVHPKVFMNSPNKVVVDANFSTIWLDEDAAVDAYALLSLLNSSWCVASMELIASVMGGGALKLEAVHLRRLPIPLFGNSTWGELSQLGYLLTVEKEASEILIQIDELVIKEIFGLRKTEYMLEKIRGILAERLKVRLDKSRKG